MTTTFKQALVFIIGLSVVFLVLSPTLHPLDRGGGGGLRGKAYIQPLRHRLELGQLLQNEGWTTGVELGVQRGGFAKDILTQWKRNTRYVLVDSWEVLENYKDDANIPQENQDKNYALTMERTKQWRSIEVCRNLTTVCARRYDGEKFDFVYVDARHDYKGVLVDLVDWWPLVTEGGIMAGHDFVTQTEGPEKSHQDWTVNYDGTVDPTGRAVYGAVVDFFNNPGHPDRYRQITVTYRESGWHTWMVRK